MTAYYSFRAHGRTAEGIRIDCSGRVSGPPPGENGFAPMEVMTKARKLVIDQFPTFKFHVERDPRVTGYPTVRYLKRARGPERLSTV